MVWLYCFLEYIGVSVFVLRVNKVLIVGKLYIWMVIYNDVLVSWSGYWGWRFWFSVGVKLIESCFGGDLVIVECVGFYLVIWV